MIHIRPYKIFGLVEASPAERIVQLQLPPRRGEGGLTLLEACIVIAATKAVKARRAFEFGTFLGSTTLNLAINIPENGEVFTLDLDEASLAELSQHPEDAALTQTHFSARTLDFMGSRAAHKVRALTGNSITFDFSPWKDSVDLVFIDGGHDLATVKADTEHAMEIAAKNTPSCILWHDYNNGDYPELSIYLEGLSNSTTIFHVEDTMICLWFNDPTNAIHSCIIGQ
jgi:hypothetical protein